MGRVAGDDCFRTVDSRRAMPPSYTVGREIRAVGGTMESMCRRATQPDPVRDAWPTRVFRNRPLHRQIARASIFVAVALFASGCAALSPARARAVGPVAVLTLRSPVSSVPEGDTVDVTVTARTSTGQPVAGAPIQAFLNDSAWGAPASTNTQGQAVLPLPLPNTGSAMVQVATAPTKTDWLWARGVSTGAPVYLVRNFVLDAQLLTSPADTVSERAVLQIAADRNLLAYLNGHLVLSSTSAVGPSVHVLDTLAPLLHSGTNVLAIKAWGGTHPAVVAKLSITTFRGKQMIRTDAKWKAFANAASGWPSKPTAGRRLALAVQAPAGGGPWMTQPAVQGGGLGLTPLAVGQSMPRDWLHSPSVTIQVKPTQITVATDPQHLVGIEYEPWFTSMNMHWQAAEAIPLLGLYQSQDTAVLRQQALWLDQADVNFLLIDWSNNLWGKTSWSQISPNIQQLVNSTTDLMNTYATMRSEGLPTPQITLLLGLDNGASTTTTAVNEEMAWVYQNYVRNPTYHGLWVSYLGKPLVVIFNGGGPAETNGQPPIDTNDFTVRWMSSQLQINHLNTVGYWSWMDGSVHPVLTTYQGQAEALTVTPAFFGSGGWTGDQAMGRLGGTTYLEEFNEAMQDQPHFLLINQFNEFAGQSRAAAVHVDTYTEQLSDDIEPTSLADCGYASCGGWGFYYLNLTAALIRMYHQARPQSTLLAIGNPLQDASVCGRQLDVYWDTAGALPSGYDILLDGHTVAAHLSRSTYALPLTRLSRGPHTLTVQALHASSRYSISRTRFDPVLPKPVPVRVSRTFTYTGAC